MGIACVFDDGTIDASSVKLKPTINERCCAVAAFIRRHATPECKGVCIEEPFSGQFSSVKALFPMMGAAVLACEEAGLPWLLVNLTKLKKHATGRGNADKEAMQAAAKERWGVDLGPDAADAAWAGAYMLDLS